MLIDKKLHILVFLIVNTACLWKQSTFNNQRCPSSVSAVNCQPLLMAAILPGGSCFQDEHMRRRSQFLDLSPVTVDAPRRLRLVFDYAPLTHSLRFWLPEEIKIWGHSPLTTHSDYHGCHEPYITLQIPQIWPFSTHGIILRLLFLVWIWNPHLPPKKERQY